MYKNHREIGDALQGADRSRLFITSKVWHTHLHYDGVLEQAGETLRDLRTEYVDLFLIHWPNEATPMAETFRGLQRVLEEGKARSIGVSNFTVKLLEEAKRVSKVPISANQIKYHPGAEQRDVLRWCQDRGVAVTAYSPLGKGRALGGGALAGIATRHGKTSAQVALRWLVQKGMSVIPKASSRAHLAENMDVFGWTLGPEEMAQIDAIAP
jgi:diketogulonate reductase-like aldo/keto reductase